jgi:hypothetical protein
MPLYRIGKRRTFDYHYEVEAKDEKEGLDLIDEDVEGTHTSAVSLTHCVPINNETTYVEKESEDV